MPGRVGGATLTELIERGWQASRGLTPRSRSVSAGPCPGAQCRRRGEAGVALCSGFDVKSRAPELPVGSQGLQAVSSS